MTGYGSASRQVSLGAGVVADLQVECRAVNSRFLDLGFRLQDECRGAEPALREMATQSNSIRQLDLNMLPPTVNSNSYVNIKAGDSRP